MTVATNGTVLWLEYATPRCERTVPSATEEAATTLLVAADVDPLVRQNVRPAVGGGGDVPAHPLGGPRHPLRRVRP